MSVPRAFWLSASVAVLIIAGSASYLLLVVLPNVERRRDQLSAEIAAKQTRDKEKSECAEQARRTGQDMARYSSAVGSASNISGVSNHYNQKLGKCIVDVQTMDKNGTAEFVMDAHEQSDILWCRTQFSPKAAPPLQRFCMDSKSNRIDPREADKQIDALMRE